MTSAVAFALALLVIFYLLLTTIPAARRVGLLKREVQIDRIRSCWGDARVELVRLTREGKLNPRSATFVYFYSLQTFVLRRPEEYKEIARQVSTVLLSSTGGEILPWEDERATWPEEMQDILQHMAAGMAELVRLHGVTRFLISVAVRITPWMVRHFGRRAKKSLQRLGEVIPEWAPTKSMVLGMQRMEQLRAA